MTTRTRLLVLLVALSLATGASVPVPAAAVGPRVTVDLSLANEIATGAVSDPDPAHARVTVSNRYHFWVGLDLQPAAGGAQLSPTAIVEDARGIYGMLGLIGPESTSAWSGTFDPAGSSQAVWVHYDLATPSGASAFALTTLTIIADTAGAPLLAKSHATVVHAITLVTGLSSEFTNLLSAVQREDLSPWEVAKAWVHLLEAQTARDALRLALADLGVIVSDGFLKSLGTVAGALDFFLTIRDLLLAGIGGHTSGMVTFAVVGEGAGASGPTQTPGSSISSLVVVPATDSDGVVAVEGVLVGWSILVNASGDWCTGGIKNDGTASCGNASGIRPPNPGEENLTEPTAPIGALIGRWDGEAWFLVGPSATLTVPPGAPRLTLAANDVIGTYGDNAGALRATITLSEEGAVPAAPLLVTAEIPCAMLEWCTDPLEYSVTWKGPSGLVSGYRLFYVPGDLDLCGDLAWKATGPPQLIATLAPEDVAWVGTIDRTITDPGTFGKFAVEAFNDAGTSLATVSNDVTLVDDWVCAPN